MNAQTPLFSDQRAAADRPLPKSGILDITPYKPGKASAEGIAYPVKLSGNENILGCSPKAREAYLAAAGELNLYPDGRGGALRAALVERYRIEPERIVLGCGTDEILHLINQVFLEPGDNIVQGQYAFGAYGIGARACQAEVRSAAEPNYRLDVEKMLELVDERTRLVFVTNPANPTGTFTTKAELARLHDGLPPSVVLVIDAAYAEFCTEPTFTDGLEMARGAPNIIVTHTFSKLHGLAALQGRLGVRAGADRRRHRPHPPAVQRLLAGPGGRGRVAGRRRVPDHLARPRAALAPVADPAARRPWPQRHAVRGQLRAGGVPVDTRQDGGRRRGLPRLAGPHRARRRQLRPARAPQDHHRPRGAQPRPRRRAGRVPGAAQPSVPRP